MWQVAIDEKLIKQLIASADKNAGDNWYAKLKSPKTVAEVYNILKEYTKEIDEKYSFLRNLMIWIIVVVGLALLGRFYEWVYRSYTKSAELEDEVHSLKEEMHRLMDGYETEMNLIITEKYVDLLKGKSLNTWNKPK